MRKRFSLLILLCITLPSQAQQPVIPARGSEDTAGVMSPAYWAIWTDAKARSTVRNTF